MSELGEGRKVWVEQEDGSQRAAVYVGEVEAAASWFGGVPGAYVIYTDTREGQQVPMVRVVPRED